MDNNSSLYERSILKNVQDIIKKMDGVLDVQKLSKESIEKLKIIERERDNDIIPVINQGVEECLKMDYSIVILKNKFLRKTIGSTVILTTDSGKLLGKELIDEDEKEDYKEMDNVFFLSEEFIIFKNGNSIGQIGEKQFFLLPPVPFPEIEKIEGIKNVISSSPSTEGDEYIKEIYDYPIDPKVATLIIGFSIEKEL